MQNNWKEEGKALRETRLSLKASPEDVMEKSGLSRIEIGDLEKGVWNSKKDRQKSVDSYVMALIEIEDKSEPVPLKVIDFKMSSIQKWKCAEPSFLKRG